MKRRFIIAVNSEGGAESVSFQKWIIENGHGWWHWIENFWLLTDATGQLDAKKIRDIVYETFRCNCLVLEFEGDTSRWAGFGLGDPPKDMFSWLQGTWMKD